MKRIVCTIGPDGLGQYPWEMRVAASDHPRFTEGTRFDWGFAHIALDEGYTVTITPVPDELRERRSDGSFVWKDGELMPEPRRRASRT